MQRLSRVSFPILLLTLMLTACGSNASGPAASSGMAATAVQTAVPAPTTVANATVVVTAPVASVAAAPSAAAASAGPFAGIEQGTTPEGYHALGSANAPATLVMYSDFL